MPLVWQTGDGGARRSSRVSRAVPTLAATEATTDAATALESYAAEARIVEERRREKEIDRADAEEAEADDLVTRSANGSACSGGAYSNAQRAGGGPPPIRAAATSAATAPLQPAMLPPSTVVHLGVTSSTRQFFHTLLQPACRQVLDEEDDVWSEATFAPLLSEEPSAEALVLAGECITVLHNAYAEGLTFSASEVWTARATFVARSECPETTVGLFPYFRQLYTAPLPDDLEAAWVDLWSCICELFCSENGKPTVTVAAATEDTEQPPTERDERCANRRAAPPSCSPSCAPSLARPLSRSVSCFPRVRRRLSAYLAGWAAFKVTIAVRRSKKDARFVKWLERCCLTKGSNLPADDAAAGYLAARMQFGGLTIPTSALVTAFTLAQHMLTLRLQVCISALPAPALTMLQAPIALHPLPTAMHAQDALARAGPERDRDETIATCYQRAVRTCVLTPTPPPRHPLFLAFQVNQVYEDAAVNSAFMIALQVPIVTRPAAAAAATPAAASSASSSSMTILEYMLSLPASQLKGLCVHIDSEFWDWHGASPPQLGYGGQVTSWFSKAKGKEAPYIEWEIGRDDAGEPQLG